MEYIIVTYPQTRTVFIDGEENGETGKRLRVEEGRHTINLGDPRDYTPKWRRPVVTNTTTIHPMVIEFERA
jgi:PEGA domain-containing protein